MNSYLLKNRTTQLRAFSLVEVVLALAVVSFACMTLLGLLPICVASFHQAMANTSESNIVQSISNDLRLDNFSVLSTYTTAPPTYYYDHEGTSTNQAGGFYAATLNVTAVTSTNSPTSLDPTGTATNAAYNVVITITSTADQTAYTLQHPHMYSLIIANNGL